MRRFCWVCCAAFAVLLLWECSAVVRAQDAPAPAAEAEAEPAATKAGTPRPNPSAQKYHFTLDEMEQFSERLGLSAEQHETFVAMFFEMHERVTEAERPLSEAQDEASAFGREVFGKESEWMKSPDRMNQAVVRIAEGQERIRQLELEWFGFQERVTERLMEDFKLLLDGEQLERLDGVVRWRHRSRLLRWSELPYAGLMVSSIARSLELAPDAARFPEGDAPNLETLYTEYEAELDRLLLRRAEVEREHRGIPRGFGVNPKPISPFTDDPVEIAWQEAVGEVNRRLVAMQKKYIRRIASLVEPERGVAFQRKCREEAYPYVLGRSDAQKELEAMLTDEVLDGEQRERVSQMLRSYTSERDALNDGWVRLIDNLVAKGDPHILASSTPLFVGDLRDRLEGDTTFSDLSDRRRELDERWSQRVRDLRAQFELEAVQEEENDD